MRMRIKVHLLRYAHHSSLRRSFRYVSCPPDSQALQTGAFLTLAILMTILTDKFLRTETNMAVDIHAEKILILDFGSQYTQLIARRVREAHVYCELHPFDMELAAIRSFAPTGIILSGGPKSVYDRVRRRWRKSCLSWECRCWASATACS